MSGTRDPLERALVRLVDAAIAGRHDAARLAYADAQALDLAGAGEAARVWAARECLAARALPDDATELRAVELLRRARRVDA